MLADRLLQVHPNPNSASVIGNTLLQKLSDRPEIDHVVHRLIHNFGLPVQRISTASPLDLRARLKATTTEEFRLGRTAEVQGWVLGETEAWLCGLAALKAG